MDGGVGQMQPGMMPPGGMGPPMGMQPMHPMGPGYPPPQMQQQHPMHPGAPTEEPKPKRSRQDEIALLSRVSGWGSLCVVGGCGG